MRDFDEEEAIKLNAEKWQTDLLELNPAYAHWGPHEDYMWTKDGDESWQSRVIRATWSEFGPWELNEYNECVNFYFSVDRESKKCPTCSGNGYHPDAQSVVDGFYGRHYRNGWVYDITQDEVQALVDENRLHDFTHTFVEGKGWQPKIPAVVPTAAEVNAWARKGIGHDAINRWILITARLKRLGLPEKCPACNGDGYLFTADRAHVSLTLWWLHPRKGCSRGIEVTRIEQAELPAIFAYLRQAAERNVERFARIPAVTP